MSSSASDKELVDAHLAGDPHAFAELVGRHEEYLWQVASRIVGDREEARDLVQECLLSAYRGIGGYRGDGEFRAWLRGIVANVCRNYFRKRRGSPPPLLVDIVETPASAPDRDSQLVLKRALDALPEDQKVAIMLVDVGGWSNVEVAAAFGVSAKVLGRWRSQGLNAMRKMLDGPK